MQLDAAREIDSVKLPPYWITPPRGNLIRRRSQRKTARKKEFATKKRTRGDAGGQIDEKEDGRARMNKNAHDRGEPRSGDATKGWLGDEAHATGLLLQAPRCRTVESACAGVQVDDAYRVVAGQGR